MEIYHPQKLRTFSPLLEITIINPIYPIIIPYISNLVLLSIVIVIAGDPDVFSYLSSNFFLFVNVKQQMTVWFMFLSIY